VSDGKGYPWPVGTYVDTQGFEKIMMALETTLGADGVTWKMPSGSDEELAALRASYQHLCKLRDEVVEMGILPPLDDWSSVNPNL
jgi:malate dehydrogenase